MKNIEEEDAMNRVSTRYLIVGKRTTEAQSTQRNEGLRGFCVSPMNAIWY